MCIRNPELSETGDLSYRDFFDFDPVFLAVSRLTDLFAALRFGFPCCFECASMPLSGPPRGFH
jgi:hypothetical protein